MSTFGRTTAYGAAENFNADSFSYAFIWTAPESGSITKLSMFGASASGTPTAKMALFSVAGGVPANRLAISAAVALSTTVQQYDFPLSYDVVAGTQYAIVIGECSAAIQIVSTFQAGLGITLNYCAGATIPATWTQSGSWDASHPVSATYTPSGSGILVTTSPENVGGQASGGDITTSITITNETAIIAVATAQDSNTANIQLAGIARGAQNFTQLPNAYKGGSGGTGQPCSVDVWYLLNPTAGTANAVADFATSINNSSITYYLLTGAKVSSISSVTPVGSTGSGTPADMTIITDSDNCLLIGALCMEQLIVNVDTPSYPDVYWTDQSFENTLTARRLCGAAGSYTMGFNVSAGGAYAQVVVAINAGGTVYVGSMLRMFQ